MISISLIITIIVLALILLLIEILIIPGIGIPGVAGTALFLIGIILAYQIDANTGHVTLGISGALSVFLAILAFNNKTWDKLAHKEEITARVDAIASFITIGSKGKTISRLNPIGKAMIDEQVMEVSSKGEYIEEGSQIEVVKIESNKVFVKKVAV